MRYSELLEYTSKKNVIVVDVQPTYTGLYDGNELSWVDELMSFLNNQNRILAFFNAEDQGLTTDTIADIKTYWEDSGFESSKWRDTEIVDKGYGYFRNLMDIGVDDRVIIKLIREMYHQRVTDSRDLWTGENDDEYEQKMLELGMPEWQYDFENSISVEWTSVSQLKRFSGSYLVGGGRNECLKEVQLLMNAFNIRYRVIEKFVYG